MASYVNLISEDALHCKDISTWPPATVLLAKTMSDAFKVPSWLKSELTPYADKRAVHLLDQLRRTTDDASMRHLWEDVDTVDDNSQRLHFAFATALSDCARVQMAVKIEQQLPEAPVPKESFVIVLVRNAILNVISGLSSLEDVPVALPRHFSERLTPVLKYITKSLSAPLVISICQKMPVEDEEHDSHEHSEQEECSDECWPVQLPPSVTMSEFLARPTTIEEVEKDVEEDPTARVLSPEFEAHFLAYPPSVPPPSSCHIPVLCMATEEHLPVVMTSLLYQRRVWHIDGPLIGIEFSKYDTTIRLYLGWLEGTITDRILPRVHLGSIETSVTLDLSSPLVSLAVSRLFMSLEAPICSVRDGVGNVAGTIAAETHANTARSWRIDTDLREEDAVFPSKTEIVRDRIIKWQESQEHSEDISSGGRERGAEPSPHSPIQVIVTSDEGRDKAGPPSSAMSDAISTFHSPLSRSRFANTSEDTDIRMFGWLFDRRVAPRSLASSDEQFRREYVAMTGLIWPQTWISREDLPPVDAALEPCVQELLTTVSAIKSKNENAVKLWHPDEFPVDLRILEESFSAIFQASRRSREKKDNGDQCEVSWRHDLDRLLFDFFIRLVESDSGTLSGGATSIADLEDPRVRPTLETTLRFPKSDVLRPIPNGFEQSMEPLLRSDRRATEQLLESRGSAVEEKRRVSNTELARYAYVTSQFSHWVNQRQDEKESATTRRLGRFPKDGKCDALGRLRVRLSGVSGKHLGQFPLVRTHPSDEAGASDAAKPGGSKRDDSVHSKPRRYTISTAASPFLRTDVATTAAVDTITSQLQHLKIEEQDSLLDLPLVAVEYKKKSGNMAQATNQLRMYLTASVKFLEAVRITDFPVYGVEADGSVVSLPVAVLRSDDSGNIVHLFERLVEKLDISSPLGAWHYATILCRLAKLHAEVLETRFETVKEPLTTALRSGSTRMEQWTITHQLATLVAENKVKFSEPQKKGGKK